MIFESVLIANRGEIACRIIRTCRRLGIRTIAVYSAADAGALHVSLADESHCIGPAEAARSYLLPAAIIAAALAHRASAIHPGYGFLSERIELAELCAENAITWIGPSPRCIASMGSKIESKRLAAAHGVPSVPGYHGDDQAPERLLREAVAIGFPVLIKASAGGGGRGMRRVDEPGRFIDDLTTAKAEAMAAFGDDRVLLERFITRPRHLEVQLAGDKHGNLIHVFERECSIQRNYQKLVEEAPAAHLPAETRARLLEAAVRLGQAIQYDSLGTVEFILEAGESQPYFLEMNTRLQVEHPVTEMITGLDLVELQLRIAAGETLPLVQADVREQGHAIELRLNAEDPAAGFGPQLGTITQYHEPSGPGLRIDSGVRVGSEVTPYYDSMLLKLIAHAGDRAGAVTRLDGALRRLVVLGTGTNQAFLRDIIRSPAFNGVLTTLFIPENFPGGWEAPVPPMSVLAAVAVAMALQCRADIVQAAPGAWGTLAGFRTATRAGLQARCRMQLQPPTGDPVTLDVVATPDGPRAMLDGALLPLPSEPAILQLADGSAHVASDGASWVIAALPLVQALGRKQSRDQASGSNIVAAMPGVVAKVLVVLGQVVRRGDVVVVQEAMKLMMPLAASLDGTVRAVHCVPGQIVAGGALLVEIEPQAA
ncbi:biotin carboxylase N-terminal domain-containing protein [Acidisphaera sp. L21]|uniref:ATP-binding protein n=1 Tax=Acidisphaera sp. L21 TaxID=1641851 RepID=UPI0020B10780|nr:biotin carboxylase N-terminal domain-containing protein [Acidisphaera sp. L21]